MYEFYTLPNKNTLHYSAKQDNHSRPKIIKKIKTVVTNNNLYLRHHFDIISQK